MTRKVMPWIIVIFATLLASGCTTDSDHQLTPANVRIYRPPQVWVTHAAPTEVAVDLAGTQASASATTEPAISLVQAGPTLDYEEYLVGEIDYLLDKIERKLDSTNVSP